MSETISLKNNCKDQNANGPHQMHPPPEFVLPVDKKWIENILVPENARTVQGGVELHQIEYDVISRGMGFVSNIVLVNLEWVGSETEIIDQLPSSIILKVATFDKMMDIFNKFKESMPDALDEFMQNDMLALIHNAECRFYDFIRQVNKNSHDNIAPFLSKILHVYHTQKLSPNEPVGIIAMENISEKAKVVSIGKQFLNKQQILNAVEVLAKFHAFCWKNPQEWKPFGFLTDLRPFFGKMIDSHKEFSTLFHQRCTQEFGWEVTLDELLRLEGLQATLNFHDQHNANLDLTKAPVIVHGDFWSHNIMFTVNKSTNQHRDDVAALIDWQLVHVGGCMEDIARLMVSSVTTEMRRENYLSILRHYYDTVCAEVGHDNRSIIPHSFDEMIRQYKLFFRCQAEAACGFIMVVDSFPFADEEEKRKRKLEVVKIVEAAIKDANEYMNEIGPY